MTHFKFFVCDFFFFSFLISLSFWWTSLLQGWPTLYWRAALHCTALTCDRWFVDRWHVDRWHVNTPLHPSPPKKEVFGNPKKMVLFWYRGFICIGWESQCLLYVGFCYIGKFSKLILVSVSVLSPNYFWWEGAVHKTRHLIISIRYRAIVICPMDTWKPKDI